MHNKDNIAFPVLLVAGFIALFAVLVPRAKANVDWLRECEAQMTQTGLGYCTVEPK